MRNAIAAVVGVFIVGAFSASSALPIRVDPGKQYCRCKCSGGSSSKYLYWSMNGNCNSNGKACKFTWSTRGSWTSGKLSDCYQCTGETGGDLRCDTPASMALTPWTTREAAIPDSGLKPAP